MERDFYSYFYICLISRRMMIISCLQSGFDSFHVFALLFSNIIDAIIY